MIDLNGLAKESVGIAEKRKANGAGIRTDTLSMLKHCATEVIEATDAWKDLKVFPENMSIMDEAFSSYITKGDSFASELADIICCVMIVAANEGVDIESAVKNCIKKNRKRAEGTGDKK